MEKVHNEASIQEGQIEQEMEFTPAYRWQHWIRAISIMVLIVTGFYISVPFITPAVNSEPTNFLQALMRSWHIIFGFVMIAVVALKVYLTLFGKSYKAERVSVKDIFNMKVWMQQLGYYMFLTKHPKLSGTYNPLQFSAYFGLYISFFVLILTGLILYVHVYHEGIGEILYAPMRAVEVMMGGLAVVREVHHIAMWVVIVIVAVHIYMAVFNAVFGKEGSMDAIFSGMKWHKKH
jgi:Ni/Fe-hydrogenase 1 B-type cytochrome subunit